jgi:ribonuclease P protein component
LEGFFNFVSLEQKIRYTLGKEERLKSRKSIELLFKTGKSFSVFPFRVLYMLDEKQSLAEAGDDIPAHSNLRAGFTASSRNFKKAVDRNRIKRLMREAYRLQKHDLQQLTELNNRPLTLFLIYVGKDLPEYELVVDKLNLVLTRLIKLTSGPN